MKNLSPMNDAQRKMVEENLELVKYTINTAIIVNRAIYGFEYDDLYQEGCILLCKAAVRYDSQKGVLFSTFAQKVVANGLRTYCRLMCNKQKRMVSADTVYKQMCLDCFYIADETERVISEIDIMNLLGALKSQYTGIVYRGIEALEWKVKGYSGTEIARMYGVKPNLVGAWISKAVKKLEQNRMFIIWRDVCLPKENLPE